MNHSKSVPVLALAAAGVLGLAVVAASQVNRPAPAQLKLNQPSETDLLAKRIAALEADAAQLKAENEQLKKEMKT